MYISYSRNFAKRVVPINCRNPLPGSTDLTSKEKRDWIIFIAVLTIVPIGLMLKQFDVTSAVSVNRQIKQEREARDLGGTL